MYVKPYLAHSRRSKLIPFWISHFTLDCCSALFWTHSVRVFVCMCTCVCVCVWVTDRESERDREQKKQQRPSDSENLSTWRKVERPCSPHSRSNLITSTNVMKVQPLLLVRLTDMLDWKLFLKYGKLFTDWSIVVRWIKHRSPRSTDYLNDRWQCVVNDARYQTR